MSPYCCAACWSASFQRAAGRAPHEHIRFAGRWRGHGCAHSTYRPASQRAADARGAELDGNLSKLQSTYGACLNTNLELAGVAREAVDRFEKVESLSRREPFTKLAKIRAQNIADETRTAISRLALKPPPTPDR